MRHRKFMLIAVTAITVIMVANATTAFASKEKNNDPTVVDSQVPQTITTCTKDDKLDIKKYNRILKKKASKHRKLINQSKKKMSIEQKNKVTIEHNEIDRFFASFEYVKIKMLYGRCNVAIPKTA